MAKPDIILQNAFRNVSRFQRDISGIVNTEEGAITGKIISFKNNFEDNPRIKQKIESITIGIFIKTDTSFIFFTKFLFLPKKVYFTNLKNDTKVKAEVTFKIHV